MERRLPGQPPMLMVCECKDVPVIPEEAKWIGSQAAASSTAPATVRRAIGFERKSLSPFPNLIARTAGFFESSPEPYPVKGGDKEIGGLKIISGHGQL